MQNPRDKHAQFRLHRSREKRRLRSSQTRPHRLWLRSLNRYNQTRSARSDRIIEYYASQTAVQRPDTPGQGGQAYIRLPKVFSFIENPDATSHAIDQIITSARDPNVQTIAIDHRACTHIDHCAESVAAVMVTRSMKMGKSIGGWLPRDQELFRIVTSVGMTAMIGGADHNPPADMNVFPLKHGKRYSSDLQRTPSKLADYLNECLERYGYILSPASTEHYTKLAAEVITNAEDHTDRPDWWVAAFHVSFDDSRDGICHIAIFNLGRSMAESLQSLPEETELRNLIAKRIRHHRFGRYWQEDDLWTVIAIQPKVSCQHLPTDKNIARGYGTAKIIKAFDYLADGRSKSDRMCLISGYTQILFDRRYQICNNNNGKSRIAFNKSNSLLDPPDRRCVRHLRRRFPGTILSLRFTLTGDHLDDIAS